MTISTFNDISTTASSNVDVNGISIQGTAAVQNFDNAFRELMAILRRDLDNGMVYSSKSANYTAVANDNNAYIRFSAAATLSLTAAATLGADWHVWVLADGGAVVVDPNSSETINGATTITIPDGAAVLIICSGTAFFCSDPLDTATLVTLTGTQTLTNKTLTSPTVNSPTITTPTGEFLRGHINGLTLSNNATDATNDIDIATGSAASDGTTPVLMALASALTKRLDASWAVGSGNGGLDTGSIANGFYYVWLIRRSDTGVVDALFSASATSPTMPTNYDQKRRIGTIWRESAAIRPFLQIDDRFVYSTQVVAAYTNTNLPTTKTTVTPTGSPTGLRTIALINARASRSTGSLGVSIWCPDLTTPSTVAGSDAVSGGANEINGVATNSTVAVGVGSNMQIVTDATGQIALQCAATTTTVSVQYLGFIDTRGR